MKKQLIALTIMVMFGLSASNVYADRTVHINGGHHVYKSDHGHHYRDDHHHYHKKHYREHPHYNKHSHSHYVTHYYSPRYNHYQEEVNYAPPPRRHYEYRPKYPVQHEYSRRPRSYTPIVAGSIIGGVIGNQFGKGSGKKILTAAGAILGGSIGRDLQHNRHYR